MPDSFPRQQARTRRFSLGAPRSFQVSADGGRVAFLRSPAGDDPDTALWVYGTGNGEERLVAAPATVLAGGEIPAEERARRERLRERASGIVAYSGDSGLRSVVFALGGDGWRAEVASGAVERLPLPAGPVFDPRLDPGGRRVAWCAGPALWVAEASPSRAAATSRRLAGEEDPAVTWGQAEFVAAEEMHRSRGYWWAPDGSGVLACRVDESPVETIWVADPVHPGRPPVAHRYPAAGTADALVTLWHLDLDGRATEIRWDRDGFPYLPAVSWTAGGPPLVAVERRDHTACEVLEVDVSSGSTHRVAGSEDPAWVAWPVGLPARLDDGRVLWSADLDDTRTLVAGGEPITPPGLQVREVHHVGDHVLFSGSDEPSEVGLWRWQGGRLEQLDSGGVVLGAAAGGRGDGAAGGGRGDGAAGGGRGDGAAGGGRGDGAAGGGRGDGAAGGGRTTVIARRGLGPAGLEVRVLVGGASVPLAVHGETPLVEPGVRITRLGPRELRAGVLLPAGHRRGDRLPVLMLPYGGPGARMVLADRNSWLEAQWRADQGFAVVVADGRGSPGRGPAWERTVHRDLASSALEDQVDALRAAADDNPDLDLARVGICGWSFGGYLSALAVIRRPDVFHAAVAGAPVTDWRLYDTYYTERYLGHPGQDPGPYDRSSLLDDAAGLSRPLLLIHGLVDDNVVVAHTLRLSQRLLEHGRQHSVLPLSGVTHMASQEDVAENLLTLQTRFLAEALAG